MTEAEQLRGLVIRAGWILEFLYYWKFQHTKKFSISEISKHVSFLFFPKKWSRQLPCLPMAPCISPSSGVLHKLLQGTRRVWGTPESALCLLHNRTYEIQNIFMTQLCTATFHPQHASSPSPHTAWNSLLFLSQWMTLMKGDLTPL